MDNFLCPVALLTLLPTNLPFPFCEEEGESEDKIILQYSGARLLTLPFEYISPLFSTFRSALEKINECEGDYFLLKKLEDRARKRLDWGLVSGESILGDMIEWCVVLNTAHKILFSSMSSDTPSSFYHSWEGYIGCKSEHKKFEEDGLLNWGEVMGYGVIDEDDSDDEDCEEDEDWQEEDD